MSSFDLVIRLKCLCFFVPEETREGKRMHVLMPNTNGHDHGGDHHHPHHSGQIDRHVVRLIYPKMGGRLDASGFDTRETGEEGRKDYFQMEGWSLVLGRGAGEADLTLPLELADLSRKAGPVNPSLLVEEENPRVISRLILEAGAVTGHTAPAIWSLGGRKGPLAQEIVWTIPNLRDSLKLEWTSVGPHEDAPDADARNLLELTPDGRELELEIHHILASEFPDSPDHPERDPQVTAEHFDIYYTLFNDPRSWGIPVFAMSEQPSGMACVNASGSLD